MADPVPARIDQTGGAGAAPSVDPTAGAADPVAGAGAGAAPPEPASKVLLTVMDNGDGTYQLVKGDESEATDAGGAGAVGGAPAGLGAAGAADGGLDGGGAGQTFNSPGALLKGILDILKGSGDEETDAASDFDAGFAGGSDGSPPKPVSPGAQY